MKSGAARPLAGLGLFVAVALIFALAVGLFRGSFTETVPVTVIADRAGLVMNPDARVKMRGVEVGKVKTIENRADGTAALHLDIYPSQMHLIPSNVLVDITSSTVFGAKFVQLMPPPDPSPQKLHEGQVIQSQHVHRRDQHRVPAAGQLAGQDRPREAQRDARRDRDGLQRPRREVRPDVGRLQRAAGQDRAEPAESVA